MENSLSSEDVGAFKDKEVHRHNDRPLRHRIRQRPRRNVLEARQAQSQGHRVGDNLRQARAIVDVLR